MKKWIELFEEEKMKSVAQQRKMQRTRNTKCSIDWISRKLNEACNKREHISKEEANIAMGCDWKLIFIYHNI